MKTTIDFFMEEDGTKPVAEYLRELPANERAALAAAFWRIETYGLLESGVDVKPIEGKLWEVKVSAQRAFYCVITQRRIVVLHAFRKKTQKTPRAEIETARRRMARLPRGSSGAGQ